MKTTSWIRVPTILIVILLASLACSITGGATSTPDSPEGALETIVAATLVSGGGEAVGPAVETPLPHSLYFLDDSGTGIYQIWRLEADGVTLTQITHEAVSVEDYTVSITDGRVAYVVNNQLFVINPDGSGKNLLVDGGPVVDGSAEYYYRARIYGLAWSPGNNLIAYGQGGISIYSFVEGSSRKVVENEVREMDDGTLLPLSLYFPHSWSADGRWLLVEVGWFEGGTLAIFDPSTSNLIQFQSNGIVCCQPAWSADNTAVLVGSPLIGLTNPGLWRYEAATGVESELIPTTSEDGTLNFVGWPHQRPNGDMLYFYNNTAEVPENETPLLMVISSQDGATGRVQLRPEYFVIYEALWAPDGSLAVLVQPPPGDPSFPRKGPIVLVDIAGNPIRPLVPSGYELQWGP
jgi:hypothetical protein